MTNRDDQDDGNAIGGALFGCLCSLPFWALMAWEFVEGALR